MSKNRKRAGAGSRAGVVSTVAQEIGSDSEALRAALAAVVTVGTGRGFVVEGGGPWHSRYIITAAHCLPERPDGQKLPPSHGFSYLKERTYPGLLAPLGEQPSVWCECLFVDPIADIAVLGAPDNQELSDEVDAYEALVGAATSLTIAEPPSKLIAEEVERAVEVGVTEQVHQWARRECRAFLLSLNNQWFPCMVSHSPNGISILKMLPVALLAACRAHRSSPRTAPPSASSASGAVAPVTTFQPRADQIRA